MKYIVRFLLLLEMFGSVISVTHLSATTTILPKVAANKLHQVYGASFQPQPYYPAPRTAQQAFDIKLQGNTSNCDWLALRNGIHNLGGDGDAAAVIARRLVVQQPRDYKEAFYTLLGPNGSDQPFSLDNLGAAPQAFVGVYQALGYDAVLLTAPAHTVDQEFAQTLRQRLLSEPGASFAHLWITPGNYQSTARRLKVAETGEYTDLLYPYHEVAAFADPNSNGLIILDSLVGYPYVVSDERLAWWLRGFNSVIVVRASNADLAQHQRDQLAQRDQPYSTPQLGGAYLQAARRMFGQTYQQWGNVIEQPMRIVDEHGTKVVLMGDYIHFERIDDGAVTLALLGVRMGHDLEAAQLLPPNSIQPWQTKLLVNGVREWVIITFGSVEQFQQVFGNVLTDEFWMSSEQFHRLVLAQEPPPAALDGYIGVLTERAMITWHPDEGTRLVPLGRIYAERLRTTLGP